MEAALYQTFCADTQKALDSGADVLTFFPGMPVEIIRWGFSVSVLVDNTQGLVVKADSIKGSTRGDGDFGTITNANGAANLAVGAGQFTEHVNPGLADGLRTKPQVLKAGEGVAIQVTTAATAGDGFPFIVYRPLNWQKQDDLDDTENLIWRLAQKEA